MKKILLLDIIHETLPAKFEEAGFVCDIKKVECSNDLKKIAAGYIGIIVRNTPLITKDIIDSADSLKFIARAGSGLENIDCEYAIQKGITIINSPEGNRDAVGEHCVGLVISLLKKICYSFQEIKAGFWQREHNRGNELMGKTIGIIGYGNTGSAFAKKLSGFDVNILSYDKYKTNFGNEHVKEVTLEYLYNNAQIVSFHVPLTEETTYYANSDFFKKFAEPIILINTSRGKVVCLSDLVDAMKKNTVIAAGLDVIEYEKYNYEQLDDNSKENLQYLFTSNNVIITPHIAGITHEAKLRHAIVLFEKISEVTKKL